MNRLFDYLEAADYTFLAEVVRSPFNLNRDARLVELAAEYDATRSAETLETLQRALAESVRYLGSSDIAFAIRRMNRGEGGLDFRLIAEDVARALGVRVRRAAPIDQVVAELAATYASIAFSKLDRDEQQRLLAELGVDADQAARFVRRSAGVFALPVAIQALNAVVVEGLIKRVIFGTIARIVGEQVAGKLLAFLAGRLPWWVNWVGPIAWAGSIGWTALDLQGPAYRKTIPVVLYLGLCVIRKQGIEAVNSYDR
jgi:uncharacterized protein YaaW (UPF0174 family)